MWIGNKKKRRYSETDLNEMKINKSMKMRDQVWEDELKKREEDRLRRDQEMMMNKEWKNGEERKDS